MRDFIRHGSDGRRLHATALGQGPVLILPHGGGAGLRSLRPAAAGIMTGGARPNRLLLFGPDRP
ncbi:hypothetical protein ABT282_01165 [Streptomyces sp. NPDC000927]|uniref:hypothetical protein n=1 Tax=unclassified Streptomyces TaxID=2593676 RepID=UPI0033267737